MSVKAFSHFYNLPKGKICPIKCIITPRQHHWKEEHEFSEGRNQHSFSYQWEGSDIDLCGSLWLTREVLVEEVKSDPIQ